MRFDIARQPLVPAFLTLLTLAIVFAWGIGADSEAASAVKVGVSVTNRAANVSAPGLATTTPDELIAAFEAAYPAWSRIIAGFLILFAGMSVGRLTVRYNLYSVGTCLAIPLVAIIIGNVGIGPDYLANLAVTALLALVTKNLSRACTNGYGFDALFRASLYAGLIVLIVPSALPVLLSLPLAILLFRRTLREAAVAIAGLLLTPLLVCYINWGAGGAFWAPLTLVWERFMQGAPFQFFRALQLQEAVLLGGIALLTLLAILIFRANAYATGNKPRNILALNIGIFLFAAATLCTPAATTGNAAFLAIPSAVLLPVLFVRINRSISLPLYLLLFGAAITNILLQYCI